MGKNKSFKECFKEAFDSDETFRNEMIGLFRAKTAKWSHYDIAKALVQAYDIQVFETGVTEDNLDFDLTKCDCKLKNIHTGRVETDTMECLEIIMKSILSIRKDYDIDDIIAVIHQIRSITFNKSHENIKVITLFD